jgi:hypothetical protein
MGAEMSRPLSAAASIGTLITLRPLEEGDDGFGGSYAYRGVVLEATAGLAGYGFAAGWGRRIKEARGVAFFGEDVMATWFRTHHSSRSGKADADYVGAEVGFTPLFLPGCRFSLGVATRLRGTQDADDAIFTWGVGVHLGR